MRAPFVHYQHELWTTFMLTATGSRLPENVERCTAVWEAVDGYVISRDRPGTGPVAPWSVARPEHVPHGALGGRDRPAVPVGVHATHRLWQGEPHGAGARLLIELHGRDQPIHGRALGQLERQTIALEQARDAPRGAAFGDPEELGEPRLVRHADRHRFAVEHREPRRGFDGVPHRVAEVEEDRKST